MNNLQRFSCQFLTVATLLLVFVCQGCAAQLKNQAGISRLGYSIQVGAFSEVKNAERLTVKLQAKGIEAFYFRKDNGVYVVRFGDYQARVKAKKAAEKLVAEKLVESYFIASPDAVFSRATKIDKPKQPDGPPLQRKSAPQSDMGAIAARTAERFVGIPYRWGGDNVVEGMDCSGFVRAVYNLCGINIPRTSAEQFRAGDRIPREELKDGDLVFFGASVDKINHVGIYVGNGRFVHAPRRGDEIKVSAIDEKYFNERFVGAKRYF
ncbi:MAG: peptidoglycan-binding lipoprotein [Deltaproteobacteria bacterium]|nr:peptidoglycan-binding lipoprotein [Deltaproteobacteria bacterium]